MITDTSSENLSVRKYRPNSPTHFIPVPDSTLVNDVIGGEDVLVMNYSLTDGGPLDDDGIENGIIVDPVGIASVRVSSNVIENPGGSGNGSGPASNSSNSARGNLATTGAHTVYEMYAAIMLLLAGALLLGSTRGSKL